MENVFIKMNTSPILPGLARYKLVRTTESSLPGGRDMSAQEWLTGNFDAKRYEP